MTAIARRPSMSARYLVTSALPAAQGGAREAVAVVGPNRRKRIQAGQAGCIKKNRRLAARFLRKEFSSKIGHLKSSRRRSRRCQRLLCNIRSTIDTHANGACAM